MMNGWIKRLMNAMLQFVEMMNGWMKKLMNAILHVLLITSLLG